MKTLVFATSNQGKLVELRQLLGDGWLIKSAADFPELPDVEETEDTFEGNATLKARAFAKATGLWALADDSGLCVDALGGAPGVWSARYAPTPAARIDKLLAALERVPQERRTAHFVCALCLSAPDGRVELTRGTCDGVIGLRPSGTGGFGYDPIFVLSSGKTMAELTAAEKSALSHRGAAFRAMAARLAIVGAG